MAFIWSARLFQKNIDVFWKNLTGSRLFFFMLIDWKFDVFFRISFEHWLRRILSLFFDVLKNDVFGTMMLGYFDLRILRPSLIRTRPLSHNLASIDSKSITYINSPINQRMRSQYYRWNLRIVTTRLGPGLGFCCRKNLRLLPTNTSSYVHRMIH